MLQLLFWTQGIKLVNYFLFLLFHVRLIGTAFASSTIDSSSSSSIDISFILLDLDRRWLASSSAACNSRWKFRRLGFCWLDFLAVRDDRGLLDDEESTKKEIKY